MTLVTSWTAKTKQMTHTHRVRRRSDFSKFISSHSSRFPTKRKFKSDGLISSMRSGQNGPCFFFFAIPFPICLISGEDFLTGRCTSSIATATVPQRRLLFSFQEYIQGSLPPFYFIFIRERPCRIGRPVSVSSRGERRTKKRKNTEKYKTNKQTTTRQDRKSLGLAEQLAGYILTN